MRKFMFIVLLAATAATLAVPTVAADDDGKITWSAQIRSRFEAVENYFDLQDSTTSGDINDDEFSFWPYRVVVGMNAQVTEGVTAQVQVQSFGHFGSEHPVKSSASPPDQSADTGDPLGFADVNLYTASIEMSKVGGSNFSVALGRMEHTYGTELFLGDNDFYNGTSFDGLRAWWSGENWRVDGFYHKTFEGNLSSAQGFSAPGFFVNGGSEDENLWGFTFDWNFDKKWGTFGAYLLSEQSLDFDEKLDTYGARWTRMANVEESHFDWNIEAAFQSGDFGDPIFGSPALDLSGDVIEGWFGYSFKHGDSSSRVHVGYWNSSGDDQATTNEDEGFSSLFGDFHANNRLGDSDWEDTLWGGPSDIEDISLGYAWNGGKHMFGVAYHMFTWNEAASYGSPEDDIGDEIDVNYNYRMNDNLSFGVLVASWSPGKVWDGPGFSADSIARYVAQTEIRW